MLKRFSGILLYLLITFFIVTIYLDQPTLFKKLETTVFDKLFQLRGKNNVPDDINIVAIDDASLKELGPWPWSREKLARLVDKVAEQQPKVILLNLLLPADPARDSAAALAALASSIGRAGNVIIPYRYSTSDFNATGEGIPDYLRRTSFIKYDDRNALAKKPPIIAGSLSLPEKNIAANAFAVGFTGVSFDYDRLVRSDPLVLSYAGENLPSATLITAAKYLGVGRDNVVVHVGKGIQVGPRFIPTDHAGRMALNFNGSPGTFKRISAADVMEGNAGKKALSGKIAIIAFTGSNSSDIYSTPVGTDMPGAEILANSIENIVHGNFLIDFGKSNLINILLMVGIGLFAAIILPRISLMYRLISLAILIFVLINVSFILFASLDMITKISYPVMMILFFMIASPTIKSRREAEPDEDADDEEIDYEQLLSATPLGGTSTPARTPSFSAAVAPAATMPLEQGRTAPLSRSVTAVIDREAHPETNFFGRYRVIEPIGKGAMGMVYKGLDPAIDRPIALKTIRLDSIADQAELSELRERLNREAKAAGKLSHPNIVTIYDVGEEGALQYIAMEFLNGRTLESLIREGHKWDYKTICKIMIQTADALDFAHEHGIVHRDVKPANIMILENDRVKVMDFGIARFDSSNMTQSGVALGTPNYISPEQLKGQPVDRRSDIFSQGVVFYELLTGERPFKGDTISALIYSILHTSPPPPSELNLDVPRIFDKIIAKALVKDPDMRFQTARELADILRKLI